jgi:WD40 repeat protein
MATGDATGAIYVWDASTFQLLMTIDEYDTGITSLSWGSENSLAAASEDGVVRIWDIP